MKKQKPAKSQPVNLDSKAAVPAPAAVSPSEQGKAKPEVEKKNGWIMTLKTRAALDRLRDDACENRLDQKGYRRLIRLERQLSKVNGYGNELSENEFQIRYMADCAFGRSDPRVADYMHKNWTWMDDENTHHPQPPPVGPDTPLMRRRLEEIRRQTSDPSTPLGAFFAEFEVISDKSEATKESPSKG